MKKYLLIGLIILMGTNLVVLSGVAFNRMGEMTTQLTLTERELSLPYNRGIQKENSGISLSIDWRKPTRANTTYYSHNSQDINITKEELLVLGFGQFDGESIDWVESRELFWALEFDGALYDAEVNKAELRYQTSLATYEEKPNETKNQEKKEALHRLSREKKSNSRLFFLEAAKDYESLSTKFSDNKNILIVKGLAKPYYNNVQKNYSLLLKHLSVSNITVPLEHIEIFSGLTGLYNNDITPPRYAVDIKWGSRLEPWIVDVQKLVD
jgi:hypothetical protein